MVPKVDFLLENLDKRRFFNSVFSRLLEILKRIFWVNMSSQSHFRKFLIRYFSQFLQFSTHTNCKIIEKSHVKSNEKISVAKSFTAVLLGMWLLNARNGCNAPYVWHIQKKKISQKQPLKQGHTRNIDFRAEQLQKLNFSVPRKYKNTPTAEIWVSELIFAAFSW